MHHHEILFNQKPASGSVPNVLLDVAHDGINKIDLMMDRADPNSLNKEFKIKFSDWGFKIDRLFEVAYRFYKRNENKAFHLGFDERNRMIALTMQAKFGNFDGSRVPDIGVLDLVGKRRQHEWSLLNGMTKTEAMTKFICELDELCPIFKAHAEAVKISSGIEGRPPMIDEPDSGSSKIVDPNGETDTSGSDVQMPDVYAALCKQTHHQFKAYAQKQHPGEPRKQKHLMASLQEQYYQQYISQLKPKQIEWNGNPKVQSNPHPAASDSVNINDGSDMIQFDLKSGESNNFAHGNRAIDHIGNIEELTTETYDASKKSHDNNTGPECSIALPNNISDINCEDNNVQADISNEELNSELDFNLNDHSQGDCRSMDRLSQSIEQKTELAAPALQIEPDKPSYNETVKPGHNQDSHPIALFESFPEPKLVCVTQRNGTSVETIDPNLPTKSIRPSQNNDLLVTKDGLGTPANAIIKQMDDKIKSEATIQQEQHNGHDEASQASAHKFDAETDAYSGSNYVESSPTPVDVTDAKLPDNSDSESQNQYGQASLATQPPYQPELWGPIDSDESRRLTDPIESIDYGQFESATIWTKRAVAEFKDSLDGDKHGGVYEVREGSVIVIQVPTYHEGKYIYWEFATDNHDIGFGVDFVYTEVLTEPLALEIYQDDDEEDDELDGSIDISGRQRSLTMVDGANGNRSEATREQDRTMAERRQRLANRVPVLPTYRRDSHEEVHVGRHRYPGRGYYLLRFDNTYSVLRSKTLYFRICFFM